MALLDWRSKRERDSLGLDTDSHIRRKYMLISGLFFDDAMLYPLHAADANGHSPQRIPVAVVRNMPQIDDFVNVL